MTVEQTDIVDFIGEDAAGNIVLIISDDLEWDAENQHLNLLQEKLKSYLRFLGTGEVYQAYENSEGKNFLIVITCKHPPNENGEDFLSKVSEIINEAGYGFSWGVVSEEQ